jgi:hypothetical protein
MARSWRALVLAAVAMALSAPLAAAEFTVYMTNGTTFESRYEPRDAEWDAQKVVLIDGAGNTISVPKSEIERIESDVAAKGFGHMLDDTTMAFGWAPNDTNEAAAGAAPASSEVASDEPAEPIYNVNETPATPLFFGSYTPPDAAAPPVAQPPVVQPQVPPAAEPPQ